MASERYLERPRAFQEYSGSCSLAEGYWSAGLLTAYLEQAPVFQQQIEIVLPGKTTTHGFAILKPFSDLLEERFGEPTWLVVTGRFAGCILSPDNHSLLRPLRIIPKYNDAFENIDRLEKLRESPMISEGPGRYLDSVIFLLGQLSDRTPDADTIWKNSLEFQRLESEWIYKSMWKHHEWG
jgi:hypothetical protein